MQNTGLDMLLKITREIAESGSAFVMRLTVLKKWFEQDPKCLPTFVIFIARQALADKGKISRDVAVLFCEAGKLLKAAQMYDLEIDRNAAQKLCRRRHAF
ncbi:MAG: hypothetical protein ACI9I0_001620 [Rhodoferax sp.]|jgi:hypothetical protein